MTLYSISRIETINSLVVFQFILSLLIIWKVSYTEIDYKTYIQQVKIFLNGERDYSRIAGDSGPLVYPAGFLYIYSVIYYICKDSILYGQLVFAFVQGLSFWLVQRLYAGSSKPEWILGLLLISKRIQSIYTLRMFNDTIAMLILYTSLFALKKKYYVGSGILFSLSVSVKMNILLFGPGYGIILLGLIGFASTIKVLFIMFAVQVCIGLPFLLENYSSYLSKAFEFNRVFDYQWTVNWKFLGEKVFYSNGFSRALLLLHLTTLLIFLVKKWGFSFKIKQRTWDEILLIIFTSNFIGIIWARSLHYQFYSWYFYTLPFILWSIKASVFSRIWIMLVIEVCWNVFPATFYSSFGLFLCHLWIVAGLFSSREMKSSVTVGL